MGLGFAENYGELLRVIRSNSPNFGWLSDPNAIATFLAVGYARAPANCSRIAG